MNVFQNKLYKQAGCFKDRTDPLWKALERVTVSRHVMIDYITDTDSRSYHYTNYPLVWNVKAYPDLDLDLDAFREWQKENSELSDLADAEKRGFVERAHKENEYELFQWGLDAARNTLDDSDALTATRFSAEVFSVDATFVGRSGGYFALTNFDGVKLDGVSTDELKEILEEFDNLTLFRWTMYNVELTHCMTRKAATDEVQYQAFWQLERFIERYYNDFDIGMWKVVESETVKGYYRVRNTRTGAESMLGSVEECNKIVELAEQGKLLGSFGL